MDGAGLLESEKVDKISDLTSALSKDDTTDKINKEENLDLVKSVSDSNVLDVEDAKEKEEEEEEIEKEEEISPVNTAAIPSIPIPEATNHLNHNENNDKESMMTTTSETSSSATRGARGKLEHEDDISVSTPIPLSPRLDPNFVRQVALGQAELSATTRKKQAKYALNENAEGQEENKKMLQALEDLYTIEQELERYDGDIYTHKKMTEELQLTLNRIKNRQGELKSKIHEAKLSVEETYTAGVRQMEEELKSIQKEEKLIEKQIMDEKEVVSNIVK